MIHMFALLIAVFLLVFFLSGGRIVTEPLGILLTKLGDWLDSIYESGQDKEGKDK